jgi:hypothetical protein
VKSPFAIAGLAAITLLVLGCSDQAFLGIEPPWWKADHETDDFSQWQQDKAGGTSVSRDGTLTIVETPVHSGHYAVKSSVGTGNPSHARLYRQDNLPVEGYYSAWFYIPTPYAVGQFWNIFEFSGRTDPTNANTGVAVWSLDLRQQSTGELLWYVYDDAGSRELKPSNPVVAPIGRWFRIQAFVRQAIDRTGRVTFWIDGALFIDQSAVSTVPSNWMSWSLGSAAGQMPQPADLYVDDAEIWRVDK